MPRRIVFPRITSTEQPLFLLGASFIGGMLSASFTGAVATFLLGGATCLWLASAFGIRRASQITPVLLFVGYFLSGATVWSLNQARLGPGRIRKQIEDGILSEHSPVRLQGLIITAPELASDRIYLEIEAERITVREVARPSSGRVRLLVAFDDVQDRRDYDTRALDYGSRIRVLCHLRRPPGYQNPGSPSLRALLDQRGLDAIGSLKSPLLIEPMGPGESSSILRVLYRTRSAAISTLMQRLRQPASGLLVASLLGNHNFLDRRVAETFRSGGTYHLLVISGLHVGLIGAALLLMTRSLVSGRLTRFLLVLIVIWGFAVMVGAQPAVTRAAGMLSLALLGEGLFRRQGGANSLGAVAMLLLIWEPRDLFNPGFHLSFLTVLAMTIGTAPLYDRLRRIGQWKPSETTPYPPSCPRLIRYFAEIVFWDERAFLREMKDSRIRFHLDKVGAARWLGAIRLSWLLRATVATLLTTIGIQALLLPLMIVYFHRVSVVAPLANVVEATLIFVLMAAGCIFLALNALNTNLAYAFADGVNRLGDAVVGLSHFFDRIPGGSFRVPDYGDLSLFVYGLYFIIALTWAFLLTRWNPLAPPVKRVQQAWYYRLHLSGAGFVISSALLLWLVVAHPFPPRFERQRLVLTVLDVGQGDAMTITFPKGSIMLLDSGGKLTFRDADDDPEVPLFVEDRAGVGELAIAPFLWRLGVKRINLIGATHSDADHVQGLTEVFPSFDIGKAVTGPPVPPRDQPFLASIRASGVPSQTLVRGDQLQIDGVSIDVLAPFPEMLSSRYSPNDRSLVLLLKFGERRFLLTGDIEKRTEALLVESGDDLTADVLKVAHHGSRTSSTREFLERVSPRFALISAGSPSPFGHPHEEVLDRLAENGAQVLQTSACGAITISSDGRDLQGRTFVRCK